jgi:hypothetical protein
VALHSRCAKKSHHPLGLARLYLLFVSYPELGLGRRMSMRYIFVALSGQIPTSANATTADFGVQFICPSHCGRYAHGHLVVISDRSCDSRNRWTSSQQASRRIGRFARTRLSKQVLAPRLIGGHSLLPPARLIELVSSSGLAAGGLPPCVPFD